MDITENPYSDAYVVMYENGDRTLHREPFYPISNKTTLHTVVEGQTIQDIAIKYYGNSGSWFRIADFNHIGNPFEELTPDMQLFIPL